MSTTNKANDRGPDGRLLRKYRRTYGPRFPDGVPKWWRKLHMTRPKRRENRLVCKHVLQGRDPDGLVMPLGNHKPHTYYW
jgi:hypothetical protein